MITHGGIGKHGGVTITGTSATTPTAGATTFCGLLVIADAVINTYAGNITNLSGTTLPAGLFLEGTFATITLTSGKVIAYNSHN